MNLYLKALREEIRCDVYLDCLQIYMLFTHLYNIEVLLQQIWNILIAHVQFVLALFPKILSTTTDQSGRQHKTYYSLSSGPDSVPERGFGSPVTRQRWSIAFS